jgi:hypothetical protein
MSVVMILTIGQNVDFKDSVAYQVHRETAVHAVKMDLMEHRAHVGYSGRKGTLMWVHKV